MISFAWPWLAVLVIAPWVLRRVLPPRSTPGAALRVPFYAAMTETPVSSSVLRGGGVWWLAVAAWIMLLLAAMRPQWLGEPVPLPTTGREMMLAIDLSGSMQERDMTLNRTRVDRLTMVKAVGSEFIQRREGDRLGLILFGERPYLQTPLTHDLETVSAMLIESEIGLAGPNKTAIGDGIGLGVKHLRERPAENRILILLTDGANNAGALVPDRAAELAAKAGVRIYTIGVGASEVRERTLFGTRTRNPSADLDEKTLKRVAAATGGRYFRARSTQELEAIYEDLDRLEPVGGDPQVYRPLTEWFHLPLALAAILALGIFIHGQRRDRVQA